MLNIDYESLIAMSDSSILWILLIVLLGLIILIGPRASASDVQLNENTGYKRPMLAFEMNAGLAPQLFKTWSPTTKNQLRTALHWDFLFIFIYPAAIAASCFIAGRYLESSGIAAFKYTLIIVFLQLIAALFDATENFILLYILDGVAEGPWPQIAKWCAVVKFMIIGLGILYSIGLGGGVWIINLFRR